jgi:integrase/recombinase XerD
VLTLYRRHRAKCPHRDDRYYRKCRCAVWCEGTVKGDYIRRSLKTRSWECGEQSKRDIENEKEPAATPPSIPSVGSAVEKFLMDAEHGRRLTPATIKKYRVLTSQLVEFASNRGVQDLSRIDVDFTREFRASWKDGAISSVKKLERLRAFFRFCVLSSWLDTNPAASVAPPVVKSPPTLPFTDKEVTAILKQATDDRWHALIQVLRWSGLRIGDAMRLTEDKFDRNRLFLRTAKTGTNVFVPLPQFVIAELQSLPRYGGYLFWKREGESKIETASGNARRALRAIFKDAGVKRGHPHRFRDTFAVGLLESGVPIETVSVLLGHSDIRITQRHYAPWVKSLQENLERSVAKAWPDGKLTRVK